MTVKSSSFASRAQHLCLVALSALALLDGGFSRVLASQSVELTWNPSTNDDIVAYVVHYGTQSHHYTNSLPFYDMAYDEIVPGLEPGKTYYFAVSAVDVNNFESKLSNEASYVVPVPDPLVLQAQAAQALQGVELIWNPGSGSDVYAYYVYHRSQSGVYTNYVSVPWYLTSQFIYGLAGGTTNYFKVSVVDANGIESQLSNEASFVVPTPAPIVLQVHGEAEARDVELTWNPGSGSDVYTYHVYYGTHSGVYSNSVTVGETNTVIHGLAGGTTNYFKVSAVDANGIESKLSNEASYVVPPPDPIVLQVHGEADARDVELTWNPSSDPAVSASYNIYYGTQSGVHPNSMSVPWYLTSQVIYGLVAGTTNYFAISAIDIYNIESPLSNEASYVVPLPDPSVLQMQTFTDGNGQSYLEISASAAVYGAWEMDCSTDLQNWNYYYSDYGYGSGNDVIVDVSLDPNALRMFFRLINN